MNLNEAYTLYKENPAPNEDAFGRALMKYCKSICKDEDAASEAILKVFENIGQYRPNDAAFATWVKYIVNNQVIDNHRRVSQEVPLDEAAHMTHDGGLFGVEERIALRQAVNSLPRLEQEFLKLKIEGCTEKELNDAFGKEGDWADNKWRKIKKTLTEMTV
jgi:RNA polymerase sigma factor (sigma-70 family)